ncbi:MAG: ATPase, partial [Candidatus Aenigmatarchaeota archaeon]
PTLGKEVFFQINETGNSLEFIFDRSLTGKPANFYVDDDFLFSATIGKKGSIKITKASEMGKELLKAIVSRKKIKVIV